MRCNKKKIINSHNGGFTLVEVMVSTALIFLVMSSVYLVSNMTFKIFNKEVKSELNSFDSFGYFIGVDSVLGKADLVMSLRSFPGFYTFTFAKEGNSGFEEIHLVKKKVLYIIKQDVSWQGELVMDDGYLNFKSKKVHNRQQNKILLKGVKSVTMDMVAAERNMFSRDDFKMMKIIFIAADDGSEVKKYFWIGGETGFSTDRDYIYQDDLDEYRKNKN